MNTQEEKNLLQYQFEKLDNAIIYRLNTYVFTDNPMWRTEEMIISTLHECQGIASAAMWLNFIDYHDYLQICKIFRECEWRIRGGVRQSDRLGRINTAIPGRAGDLGR